MKSFLDDNFLLSNATAEKLYHGYASQMPIIDYHNHLPPKEIAQNRRFENITQLWLNGDHYKWRAMRANGIDEKYITGNATDKEKFEKWAATLPYTLRNPLYHWSHLELRRYFGIDALLTSANAGDIYEQCNAKLASADHSVQGLLAKMNVEVLCTTDDPLDSLEFHRSAKEQDLNIKVFPAFRPDKAMAAEDTALLNDYINKLSELTGLEIHTYNNYLQALKVRHNYFAANGCIISDHGLEHLYADDHTEAEISAIFRKIRANEALQPAETNKFRSAMLLQFAEWDHEKDWVQQYHIGALRNNNTRLLSKLGPDTGFDSIGDLGQAKALSTFLNTLDKKDKLTKTIVYNLNPADNAMIATMVGNFNDGTIAGKIQHGAAWWFLDQKDGIIQQLNALSNMGLLSKMVGMLTDSRSFLSFPRHEYFRRILCNLLGTDIENGELPNDLNWTGKIVQDICYYNAKAYFNF